MKIRNEMIPVDKALKTMLDSVNPLGSEMVPLLDSPGRILYNDITADINIPPMDNSAMDGFALTGKSLINASEDNPVTLDIIGEIQAGSVYQGPAPDEMSAVRIMTGAPIPPGADAVIQVEDTTEKDGKVTISRNVLKGENIRKAGEDISIGRKALHAGHRLNSPDIGLLASLNRSLIEVYKKPAVAIISTGDELADVGEKLGPGQIRNSNAYALYAEVKKYAGVPYYLGIASDTVEDTREKFKKAFEHDIVITTGGVSMGKYDFVAGVMEELGIHIKVQKILMKPGKPLIFGTLGEKLFFGLPGNPVSTMVSFTQFVRPVLLKFMGAACIEKPVVQAILGEKIKKKPERRHFIRGHFTIKDGIFHVSTTGPQGSGILSSMSHANCLIILPEGTSSLAQGDPVSIQLLYHEEI